MAAILTVHLNQLVQVNFPFLNASSVATDPTTITAKVKDPTGTDTTYTLAGGGVVKDSTGNYHVQVTPATAGVWSWHVESTGPVQASDDGQFIVLAPLA